MTGAGRVLPLLGLLLALAPAERRSPEAIEGLVARYEAGALKLADDSKVESWPDSAGRGHDLIFDGRGLPARFRTQGLGKKAIVKPQKGGAYRVLAPFDLDDHTIFLVYRSGHDERVLFSSELQPMLGVVLRETGRHLYRSGGVGTQAVPYTRAVAASTEFGVTVLGREEGRLRAFVNEGDVSSGAHITDTFRVGKLFEIVYSQFVDRDGLGLELAEMLFYDRFLDRAERDSVTAYLIDRYGLRERMHREETLKSRLAALRDDQGAQLAWLGTDAACDLNRFDEVAAVSWTRRDRVDPAFGVGADEAATRIECKRDATLVRVYLSLPLVAARPGSNVRVLLLKNGATYHEDDGVSGAFGGEGAEATATVELETTILMDTGDFMEVVAQGIGEPGEVRLLTESALFVAEAR